MYKNYRISELIAPSFYDMHRRVRDHAYGEYMLAGGRGSTKSSFISMEILMILKQFPDVNAVIYRKHKTALSTSVFEQMLWAIERLGLSSEFKHKVSPLEITYKPTGQKILFRGLDDPMKSKSMKLKRGYFGVVWFEELDEFSGMEAIRSVKQSLGRGGNDVWTFYSYNPPKSRDNWVNQECLLDKKSRIIHKSTYLDVNPEWLGQNFIREAEELKTTKPDAYLHEYIGEVTGTGGTVFENVTERIIDDNEINTFGCFYEGLDFGFSLDPLAWVKMAYNSARKTLYFVDEVYGEKMSNAVAVNSIRKKKSKHIYADSAEPRTISEFRELGLVLTPATKGPGSVDHGVKWLQGLNEIVFDKRRTPNAYREFFAYEYERRRDGTFISSYPDKGNHAIDSARYGMQPVISPKTVTGQPNIKGF
jgi:phage terminase, large subunit, PBSX family